MKPSKAFARYPPPSTAHRIELPSSSYRCRTDRSLACVPCRCHADRKGPPPTRPTPATIASAVVAPSRVAADAVANQ
uniref:Uncharacterized protein n=1 Tax=Arundo donax TaxID=35708 RepID=A0A0A9AKV3_ARUDO